AYFDKEPGAISRLASSAGYLFERGALDGKVILSADLNPTLSLKEARSEADYESLLQNTDFALDLLRATVILDKTGLPDSEIDVAKAWRNYNYWQVERINNDPLEAIDVYGGVTA